MSANLRIGIPRALLYYEFNRLWTTFFEELGAQAVVSKPTDRLKLDQGSFLVVAEACLPVKVFFGHAASLAAEKVDALFIPRIVSIEPKAYICPKIMGLPDMLAASRADLPEIIKPSFNRLSSADIADFLAEAGQIITSSQRRIWAAWQKASRVQEEEDQRLTREFSYDWGIRDNLTILLVGHRYLLDDEFLNMNLLKKLKAMGCSVMQPVHIPRKWKQLSLKHLPKQLFWSYGRDLLGAVYCFSQLPGRKASVILTSFGCGVDSFIGNMIMRHFKRKGIPHLVLTLDEHSGEAGLDTRIEAFIDMLLRKGYVTLRRTADEDNFPSYG